MQIDYQKVEQTIRASYSKVTEQYRLDDEIEVTTENHRRLCGTLKEVCRGFLRPITVLDVGCGTGRYFHCLENVDRLVGLDISDEMLQAARSPVRRELIVAKQIDLIRGNAFLAEFGEGEFDFIYSLGMFGNGCPLDRQVCEKFYKWLRPGGKLFFNIVDFAGLPFCYKARRLIKAAVYPVLPRSVQARLDHREARSPFFWMTASRLRKVLNATSFNEFSITSHECKSPLGNGRHLECIARKV